MASGISSFAAVPAPAALVAFGAADQQGQSLADLALVFYDGGTDRGWLVMISKLRTTA